MEDGSIALVLREARADDIPALASLHVQTFNETHRGVLRRMSVPAPARVIILP